MQRFMFKSKIHRATVTGADLDYEGSIAIDEDLLKLANILPGERVDIYNITNGNRLSTYTILGEPGSGTIMLNGAAAHLATPGDLVIIVSYCCVEDEEAEAVQSVVVLVDENNKPLS